MKPLLRNEQGQRIDRFGRAMDFETFSKAIKAVRVLAKDSTSGKDELYLEAPASSNVVDRMGDRIMLSAQKQMESAARGMTIFLNHEYDVPEDVAGSCDESYLRAAADEADGIFDLWVKTKINQQNPRAVKTWELIEAGAKLGYSIGGALLEYEFVQDDEKRNARAGWMPPADITGIDLYEISIVGIPANQRAIIDDVVKGLSLKTGLSRPETKAQLKQREIQKKLLEQGITFAPEAGDDKSIAEIAADADAEKQKADKEKADDKNFAGEQDMPEDRKAVEDGSAVVEVAAADDADKDAAAKLEADAAAARNVQETSAVATKAPGDELAEPTVKKLYKCMKSLSKAMDHGTCATADKHVKSANDVLLSLIPAGYADPEPDQDDKSADDITIKLCADTSELQAQLKTLQEQLDALKSENEQVSLKRSEAQAALVTTKAEHDALNVALEEKRKEADDLDARLTQLKAYPLGHKTKAAIGGSYSGSGSTVDPERRKSETEADLKVELRSRLAGIPEDPRSRQTASL
ncbi:MAG: HK97 family phage prohead protease [Candidatus Eremiobacter antarcticus]|nr:HK97 family phage prohead protease [Candidatus Eremiobacteraeota bacterium]MBC5808801.1 HK97 family phage prohead protease [Candidatus Eremiobacteraeota bacterium]